jgi:hypothetical protein
MDRWTGGWENERVGLWIHTRMDEWKGERMGG